MRDSIEKKIVIGVGNLLMFIHPIIYTFISQVNSLLTSSEDRGSKMIYTDNE